MGSHKIASMKKVYSKYDDNDDSMTNTNGKLWSLFTFQYSKLLHYILKFYKNLLKESIDPLLNYEDIYVALSVVWYVD